MTKFLLSHLEAGNGEPLALGTKTVTCPNFSIIIIEMTKAELIPLLHRHLSGSAFCNFIGWECLIAGTKLWKINLELFMKKMKEAGGGVG